MPLTPADIHNVEFGKATLGKRGYDEEEVDTLLDEISMEMISLLEENAELQTRAVGGGVSTGAGEADLRAATDELRALTAELDRAREARDRAGQRADALRRELDKVRAARAAAPAAPTGDGGIRVLAMAQQTAEQHLDDARRESETVLADARERSGRMVREARESANDIERDAGRREVEAKAELEARQAGALRDIKEMTSLAEEYYGSLREHMLRQQNHLVGPPRP